MDQVLKDSDILVSPLINPTVYTVGYFILNWQEFTFGHFALWDGFGKGYEVKLGSS